METPLLDFLGRRAGYSSFSRSSSQSLSCFKPSSCFKSALCFLKKSTLVYFAKPASVNTWLWTSSACPPCPRVGELAEDFYARVMTRLISARLQHVDGQMRNLAARRRHARHRPLSRLAEQPLQVPAQAPFPVAHDRHRNSFPNGIASLSKGCAPQTLDPGQTDAVAGPSPSCGVIALARVVVQLLADLADLVVLLLRPRAAVDSAGTAPADPAHGERESTLGRRAHRQRIAAEARPAGLRPDGAQVHADAGGRWI